MRSQLCFALYVPCFWPQKVACAQLPACQEILDRENFKVSVGESNPRKLGPGPLDNGDHSDFLLHPIGVYEGSFVTDLNPPHASSLPSSRSQKQ
jgi:hypothetical protein